MWVKVVLLICYLLALFVISRLLEAAAWYEAGFLPYRILDPFALSVRKLKRLLDVRGVSYAGFLEKHELQTLLQTSGEVMEGELLDAPDEDDASATPTSTHFTGGNHFYEEVEDTKDSVWLVQVVPQDGAPLLTDLIWRKLHARVGRFGVRTGIFDCAVDRKLCNRKGWLSPQLILALPKGHRAKDTVVLHSYSGWRPTRLQPVLDWLHRHLLARVNEVSSTEELKTSWLGYPEGSKQSEVRLLLFSALLEPPLFLLALGVKFSGRVRVGMVHVKDKEKAKELESLGIPVHGPGNKKLPTYLVVTPERIFTYGKRVGEYLSYQRMELFLRSLRPEMNDVFLLSLLLVNVLGGLNLFLVAERTWWRQAVVCVWRLSKANCMLFLAWLVILGLGQLAVMEDLSEMGLKAVRLASGCDTVALVRHHWFRLRAHPELLIVSFVAFTWAITVILSHVWRRLFGRSVIEGEEPGNAVTNGEAAATLSDWWSVSLDSYLMDCFFRPMATLTQPLTPSNLDLEEGMEMIIERLAVPHFWLQPIISSDYVKDLPCWTHYPQVTSCSSSYSSTSESECDGGRNDTVTSGEEDETALRANSRRPPVPICNCHCLPSPLPTDNVPHSDSRPLSLVKSNCHCPRLSEYKHSRRIRRKMMPAADDGKVCNTQPPVGILECHECAICLDTYKSGAVLCGLPCGHSYHQQCILLWLSRDNHHCPVCRWPTYKNKSRSCHQHID